MTLPFLTREKSRPTIFPYISNKRKLTTQHLRSASTLYIVRTRIQQWKSVHVHRHLHRRAWQTCFLAGSVWVYTWSGPCALTPTFRFRLCRHGVHCCTAGQRGSALMGVAVEFLRLVTRDLPLARWLRTCVRYKRGERGWTSTFRSSLVNRCATSLPFAVSLFLHAGLSFNRDFFNIFIDHLRLIMLFKGEKVSASGHHF